MKNPVIKTACFYLLAATCAGCNLLNKTSSTVLQKGAYTHRSDDKKDVYINITEQGIEAHPVSKQDGSWKVDSTKAPVVYPFELKGSPARQAVFHKYSFDIDFLTIPLKLRPAKETVPAQLNSNLNGALFFGYRTDEYKLNYQTDLLGESEMQVSHFGFSLGVFTGLGNTLMSPTNTNDLLQQEYDGLIWSKGLTGIIAVNSFTIGISAGFDNLLDKNRKIWIYETQPWIGLAFGINLN